MSKETREMGRTGIETKKIINMKSFLAAFGICTVKKRKSRVKEKSNEKKIGKNVLSH